MEPFMNCTRLIAHCQQKHNVDFVSPFRHKVCIWWDSAAMSLQDLPFSLDQLSWEKFGVVKKHLKLSKAECFTIMQRVLGDKPDETWQKTPKQVCFQKKARYKEYVYRV